MKSSLYLDVVDMQRNFENSQNAMDDDPRSEWCCCCFTMGLVSSFSLLPPPDDIADILRLIEKPRLTSSSCSCWLRQEEDERRGDEEWRGDEGCWCKLCLVACFFVLSAVFFRRGLLDIVVVAVDDDAKWIFSYAEDASICFWSCTNIWIRWYLHRESSCSSRLRLRCVNCISVVVVVREKEEEKRERERQRRRKKRRSEARRWP